MKYEIAIKVDTNDADYVTEISEIDSDELQTIKPLIEAIKGFQPYEWKSPDRDYTWKHDHNYPTGECIREDLGQKSGREYYGFSEEVHDLFEDLLPFREYGFHTIESITITPAVEKTVLL